MAATVTVLATVNTHNEKTVYANFAFDSAYVTGGEPFTPEDFGLQGITTAVAVNTDDIQHRAVVRNAGRTVALYLEDATSGKEAEFGSTVDASAINVTLIVVGT